MIEKLSGDLLLPLITERFVGLTMLIIVLLSLTPVDVQSRTLYSSDVTSI